ncbi:peptidase S8/S53 domain-containing protein [Lophiotrema nucula]|uniref:Peptidase S8/S53 domain-containing protein n=1 Tax=Lophiotrema nucula TaxID=690887 RepID=A0A6A5ZKR9_9PLEO|nr:peptidase S8/S53 domain-containing protein [Lophiotrema nucula]
MDCTPTALFRQRPQCCHSGFRRRIYTRWCWLGVDVYVLDTGLRIEHELLNTHGTNARRYQRKFVRDIDGDTWHPYGHGTGAAGMIKTVAPHSNIIDVKVTGANGDAYTIGRAIYSITSRHISLRDREPKLKDWFGSVINLSLASSDVPLLRHAVADAIAAGVPIVASSGNFEGKSCRYPAFYLNVICVGGITRDYTMYEKSNYGKGLTVWAGGKNVYTSTRVSDRSYGHFDGTSLAAPQVAGMCTRDTHLQIT